MAFRRAIAWSVSGQILSYLVLFGGSVIVARLLTPHDTGVYAIAMATMGILGTLTSFNVGTYIIRDQELSSERMDSAFTVNAISDLFVAAAILASSFVARVYYHSEAVAEVLAPMAVIPLLAIFELKPSAILQRNMKFKAVSVVTTARSFLSTILSVALAMRGFSYMSLAYSSIFSSFFSMVAMNLAAGNTGPLRFSLFECRKIMTFGIRMMSIGGIANLTSRLSDMALGHFLGLSNLGLYSRASNISTLIFQNVYGAATRVVFVKLSNDLREKGSLRDSFLRSFELITAVLLPMQIGLAVLSGPAVLLLYGERWLGAALPLSLLMIAQSVAMGFGMNWELFVLRDETARQTRFEFIRAVVGIVTFVTGCMFSIAAAAVGRIAEAVFGLILYQPHMHRLADIRPGQLTSIYLRGLALTAAAVSPAVLLMSFSHWSPQTPMVMVAGAVALGIVLWLAAIVMLKHPLLAELKSVQARLLDR